MSLPYTHISEKFPFRSNKLESNNAGTEQEQRKKIYWIWKNLLNGKRRVRNANHTTKSRINDLLKWTYIRFAAIVVVDFLFHFFFFFCSFNMIYVYSHLQFNRRAAFIYYIADCGTILLVYWCIIVENYVDNVKMRGNMSLWQEKYEKL